jgi:hypothetical protein
MTDVIIENIVRIVAALLMMLISVGGAYLTSLIAKHEKLKAISEATQQVIDAAIQTTGELQQTVVGDLKQASVDGKLSKEEIDTLYHDVVVLTLDKLSAPTINLLNAVGADIEAIIHGATEDWINTMKPWKTAE